MLKQWSWWIDILSTGHVVEDLLSGGLVPNWPEPGPLVLEPMVGVPAKARLFADF